MFLPLRKVYLDHNATTPLHPRVIKIMHTAMRKNYGNPSSLHTQGRQARGALESARAQIAALLGAAPERLVFTSGGSEANNTVLKGLFSGRRGGHMITSKIEHDSILGAARQLQKDGVAVTMVNAGADGRVKAEEIAAAVRDDTRLISIMHANNETGAIQPLLEIRDICRQGRIFFHSDAVQSAGKIAINVNQLDCDFLTASAHKFNGPKGVGILYVKDRSHCESLIFGGSQENYFRAGTENLCAIVGMGEAALLKSDDIQARSQRLRRLRDFFLDELRKIFPELKVNEAAESCQLPGTMNLTFPGIAGVRLLAGLDSCAVAVSIGSACTADNIEPSHVLLGMGLDAAAALSSIRLSMGDNTGMADLRAALKAFKIVLNTALSNFEYIMPENLEKYLNEDDVFLIDLRTPLERMLTQGLEGAHEWSHINFDRFIKKIPFKKTVLMVCGTGLYSTLAGDRLARAGHPRVKVIYGGYGGLRALKRI
ncbi:MAG: aminotransferase class V-fold PLP-dependent enzyme [Desulfarculales bacterium]|jgi:cysteine desulfurase|nr:aminotransferase class V-fold PLP-dependent enzyme [Desulfarculales bacterium]